MKIYELEILSSAPRGFSACSHVRVRLVGEVASSLVPTKQLVRYFGSKGTITYDQLDIPDFLSGYLEYLKEQPERSKVALLTHLQLLKERVSTYV